MHTLMAFPVPFDEGPRLASLRALRILDTDPEALYDDVVALASAICGTPIAAINFVDADRQWTKAGVPELLPDFSRDIAMCARTLVTDDLLVIRDTQEDATWSDNPLVTGPADIRFYAGAAVRAPDGHAVGALCVVDHQPRDLRPEQLEGLRILARQTAALLDLRSRTHELSDANERLKQIAVRDALTGLPNRVLLYDRLERALAERARTGRRVGVLFCDLDGFKAVNDRHGHQTGDAVLRATAERLTATARDIDTVARLAGDEFVVVCPDLGDEAALGAVSRRLREAVAAPLAADDAIVTPRLSVGAVLATEAEDAATVLRRADQAMYAAKRAATHAAI